MADSSRLKSEAYDQMLAVSAPKDKASALQLLERMGALDVAEMLGLLDGQ